MDVKKRKTSGSEAFAQILESLFKPSQMFIKVNNVNHVTHSSTTLSSVLSDFKSTDK